MEYDAADNSRQCYEVGIEALRQRLEASKVTIGNCTLYREDCAFVLPTIPKRYSICSDPPYGIGFEKGDSGRGVGARRNSGKILGDDKPFDPAPLLEFDEVLLFGANHYAARLPEGAWHVWDKLQGVPSFDSFSDAELIWLKGKPTATRIVSHLWKGVLKASEKDAVKVHVSQKPVAVMAWCLRLLKGQTIVDPYMGSGSTGVACVKLGREFIGIEKDEKHFATACRRIEEAQQQGDFFSAGAAAQKPEQMSLA